MKGFPLYVGRDGKVASHAESNIGQSAGCMAALMP